MLDGTNTYLKKIELSSPRSVILWHVHLVLTRLAHTHFFDTYLKGRKPEPCAKEVAAFVAQFKPGQRCFLESSSEKTRWNGNPYKPNENGTV